MADFSQKKYEDAFKDESGEIDSILKAAYQQATDIRKFEIELYWKRATYFWALIVVAFTGYFAILSAKELDSKYFFSIVLASIGFIFSLAWILVNQGSKFWQQNWEYHIDLLEDKINGPLYKVILSSDKNKKNSDSKLTKISNYLYGPQSFSVSKINQFVSYYVLILWSILIVYSSVRFFAPNFFSTISIGFWRYILGGLVLLVLGISAVLLIITTRSHISKKEKAIKAIKRNVEIAQATPPKI